LHASAQQSHFSKGPPPHATAIAQPPACCATQQVGDAAAFGAQAFATLAVLTLALLLVWTAGVPCTAPAHYMAWRAPAFLFVFFAALCAGTVPHQRVLRVLVAFGGAVLLLDLLTIACFLVVPLFSAPSGDACAPQLSEGGALLDEIGANERLPLAQQPFACQLAVCGLWRLLNTLLLSVAALVFEGLLLFALARRVSGIARRGHQTRH
jgi:hypothetical protein